MQVSAWQHSPDRIERRNDVDKLLPDKKVGNSQGDVAREPQCRDGDVNRTFSNAGNGHGKVVQGQIRFQTEFSCHTRLATGKQKAHEPKFVGFLCIRGRPCWARTSDQRIKSPLLYQLS
jgi:hypothetical protein